MQLWEHILTYLQAGKRLALLYVLRSEGSSPGRQGFNMIASEGGEIHGSIGGGFMEHKLVELARSKMDDHAKAPFIKHQVHRKDATTNQSGMICSGEQTVAFYFLDKKDITCIQKIIQCLKNDGVGSLQLTEKGIEFIPGELLPQEFSSSIKADEWMFKEQIGHKNTLYIVGGGHVGCALSETMARLGFYIEQIDNREGLNTMINNPWAHKKHIVQYDQIDQYIPEGERTYIALVSFGYRTDKVLLKNLIRGKYKYLGMLGSEEKVKRLFEELEEEGVSKDLLSAVHAPIGIQIHSKTPEEIALSIAAEIIQVKNSSLNINVR